MSESDARSLLTGLMSAAFIELRANAHDQQWRHTALIAALFHNVPGRLNRDLSWTQAFTEFIAEAEDRGAMFWVRHHLEHNGGVSDVDQLIAKTLAKED